ncbi:MAG: hypothetical protein EBZ50_03480 [Alphaproteobacteria bacterium]|nr:hypothetical protein [Alphaproteobacteria bacterium]
MKKKCVRVYRDNIRMSSTSSSASSAPSFTPAPAAPVECGICLQSISTTADAVTCPYCNATCCSSCLEKYILSRKVEPICFGQGCNKPYSDVFLYRHTSKTFRTKRLRDHMKEILWDRERALMPLSRDFAFVVDEAAAAADLVRAAYGADKALISDVALFDVYRGPGVPDGKKSIALEVSLQPREKTLTDAEIETTSAKIVAAVGKATGAVLRG